MQHRERRSAGADKRISQRRGSVRFTEKSFNRRLLGLSVSVGVIAIGLTAQMVRLQGAAGAELVAKGRKQRVDNYKVEAQRGSILDRNGVELAVSIPRRSIAIDKVILAQAGFDDWGLFDTFSQEIAPYLGMTPEAVADRLKNSGANDRYVLLARYVPTSDAAELRKKLHAQKPLLASSLVVERSSERINPSGDSGLRVIGKLGLDGPARLAGIERQFDAQMRGTDGESRVELKNGSDRNLSGWSAIVTGEGRVDLSRKSGALPDSEQVIKAAVPGSSVQLTLDRALQHDAERILAEGATKAGARKGIAIVGKPSTGELLAVASVEVDPKTGEMGLSAGPIAFSNAYQAGSVFKLVTVAAGIEAGVVSADTSLSVPDHLTVSDRNFSDHDPHPTEPMTVTDIVSKSSNVGTIMVAQKVGKKSLHDTLLNFGFGSKSGIGHPAEAAGTVPPFEKWTDPDLASASIGTHESATALQLWAAYNVVANGGMYVPPRLVDAILHPDGTAEAPRLTPPRRVVSVETASALSGILQSVITDGTAKQWTMPGYSVAAKTGTSRMPSPTRVDKRDGYMWEDGAYHYLAAFTGFLPAERPQVSITVILDDVNQGLYGSTAAGPVFSQLARLSIRELGIAPDGSVTKDDGSELLPGVVRTGDGRIRSAAATATTTTVPAATTSTTAVASPSTTVPASTSTPTSTPAVTSPTTTPARRSPKSSASADTSVKASP